MKNKIIIIIASWACVLLTMIMIFNFSEENAEQSTQTSSGVIENVLTIVMPKEEITDEVIEKFQFPFRKMAHFGIYMLLGFSLSNAYINTIKNKSILSYLLGLGTGFLYASLDEWHQNFSSGRGPSFTDVMIDTSGVLVGIALFIAFISLYKYIRNKKMPIK